MQALEHYDNQEFDQALKVFDGIAETSKILFNCGVIYATIGEHEKAVRRMSLAMRSSDSRRWCVTSALSV